MASRSALGCAYQADDRGKTIVSLAPDAYDRIRLLISNGGQYAPQDADANQEVYQVAHFGGWEQRQHRDRHMVLDHKLRAVD